MTSPIRIAIIDDHAIFREGLALILRNFQEIEVDGFGSSANDAVRIAATFHLDQILLDIDMPGNSFAAAQAINKVYPQIKIIFLTASESEDNLISAFRTGARAYVLKGISSRELVCILLKVQASGIYVPQSMADLVEPALVFSTTPC